MLQVVNLSMRNINELLPPGVYREMIYEQWCLGDGIMRVLEAKCLDIKKDEIGCGDNL